MNQPSPGAPQSTPPISVVAEDGQPVDIEDGGSGNDGNEIARQIQQPAKVMRIGTMVKQLLEEVRAAPLDDASRKRLKEIYEASINELEKGLAPELIEELERMSLPFGEGTPTEGELRIAQAQLVGWLEGLFHGIQTALFAQQVAARASLEQMRRPALPAGQGGMPVAPGQPQSGMGQYL